MLGAAVSDPYLSHATPLQPLLALDSNQARVWLRRNPPCAAPPPRLRFPVFSEKASHRREKPRVVLTNCGAS